MLYYLIKILLMFVRDAFFRRIRIFGEKLEEHSPLIVVSNHPNFFMDPLLVGSIYRRPLWFMAKATLFSHPWARKVLLSLHAVPIHRRKDDPSQMYKNEEAFGESVKILKKGGALAVFPEGVSLGLRQLQPIKTGAARIALKTEVESNFQAGVKVQAIGINYSTFHEFQSVVELAVQPCIKVADFRKLYEEDPIEAVAQLTQAIEVQLLAATVGLADAENEKLLHSLSRVYTHATESESFFERYQLIAANLNKVLLTITRENREIINRKLEQYFMLRDLGGNLVSTHASAGQVIFVTLVSPFVLLGVLLNYLPYRTVGLLAEYLAPEPVVIATYKFALGIIVFTSWYLGLVMLGLSYGEGLIQSISIALISLASAFFANRYANTIVKLVKSVIFGPRRLQLEIGKVQSELINILESLRVV